MRRPPIRIRTFILGTVLVLLLVPTLAGGAGLADRTRPPAGRHPAAAEHRPRLPHLPSHRDARAGRRPGVRAACSTGSTCSRNWSSSRARRPGRASSTSARPSARPSRRNRRARQGRPASPARQPRPRRPGRVRPGPMTTGSSRSRRPDRGPLWSPTSTTGPPPAPPGRSSRSSAESSSCSPGSRSRSGSPAAGWSRRSPG